jgi:hypothetical protein
MTAYFVDANGPGRVYFIEASLLKLAMRGLDLQGGASYPIPDTSRVLWTTVGEWCPYDETLWTWEYHAVPAFWIAEAAEEEITDWMEKP